MVRSINYPHAIMRAYLGYHVAVMCLSDGEAYETFKEAVRWAEKTGVEFKAVCTCGRHEIVIEDGGDVRFVSTPMQLDGVKPENVYYG